MLPKHKHDGLLILPALILSLLMFAITPAAAQSDVPEGAIIVGSTDGAFSLYAPSNWVFESMAPNIVYPSTLLVAENEALLEDLAAYQLAQPTSRTATGSFAIVAQLSTAFWQSYATNVDQAVTLTMDAVAQSSTIFDQFTIEIGDAGYSASVIETTAPELNARGYIGVFAHNGNLYVFQLMTAPIAEFQNNTEILETMGASISVPAVAGAVTDRSQIQATPLPTSEAVVTPEVIVTEEGAPALYQIDAENSALSIVLPDLWFYQDRTADEGLFIYGNLNEAVDSRLYALRPTLFESPLAMSGQGGVIELYALSEFGLSAGNPDVSPLMAQVLDGLVQQGYEIVEEATAFDLNGYPGQLAVIRGSEYGFLALVAFEEHLGYITATGTDADFEANREALLAILQSIHVPAAEPEPTPTPQSGLGGLGGLRGGEATETPVPATGLGGLGGLRGGDATEEADVIEEAVAEETAAADEG